MKNGWTKELSFCCSFRSVFSCVGLILRLHLVLPATSRLRLTSYLLATTLAKGI